MTSIDIEVDGISSVNAKLEEAKPGTAEYRVSANTDYAVYVEFGTRYMEAQPYLRPAVNQTMREADAIARSSDSVEEFVEELAENIAERAKDEVPVRTGRLKRSIKVEKV